MFLPESVIKQLKEKYAESSIRTYSNQLKALYQRAGLTSFTPDFLMDQETLIRALNTIENISTRKCTLNAVMKILKICYSKEFPKYNEIFRTLATEHNDQYLMSKAKKELISSEKIDQIYQEYHNKVKDFDHHTDLGQRNRSLFLRYLLVSLYKFLPPLRGQDYFSSNLVDTSSSPLTFDQLIEIIPTNFYDLHTKKLVIKEYKTVKTHGIRVIDVPSPLDDILLKWSMINNTDYLIPTTKNTRMTTSSFRDLLTRTMGVSVDVLRQSYITEKVSKMTPAEAKHTAKIMGHTLSAQQLIYKKISDD